MKLYLIRHTTPRDVAASDDERRLTAKGEEEARIVGGALAKMGVSPIRVLTSPLVRAQQTADIIAQELSFTGSIEIIEQLKNGVPTASLLRALPKCTSSDELLLVGHMPSLAEHAAVLTGAQSAEPFVFGKGSVACIEMTEARTGSGRLVSLQHQADFRKIS